MTRKITPVLFLLLLISAQAESAPVDEARFVSIGGIEQWITIDGNDSSKPVILFLHGGPGSTITQYKNAMYTDWEKDFVLVNWDQRGAGRTFGRNAPAEVNEDYWIENPLTVDQMVADGIELSKYLLQYLGKQKIILVGTSWGSVLGVKMALASPELFYAYVGHSQVVNPTANLKNAYDHVLGLAQTANDSASLEKLKSIGTPPYDNARNAGMLFRIIKKYEAANSDPSPDGWWQLKDEYNNEADAMHHENGDDYSFINYVGHKAMGIKSMAEGVDFMKDGLSFQVPVYFVQGQNDILTAMPVSKAYFDMISAPQKKFIEVSGAAHGHNQAVIDAQYKIVFDIQTQ
ncbi:MAG TPA: alpha/beta hydrolase [Chryseosolibacter sp.]|nr:alpha/beta hydrolase [Chryseosolibacter sp.]